MPSNELRPFIARYVPPHQSLSAKYICHFRKKVIRYISVHGANKDITHQDATALLSNSVAEEKIATDSSICRNYVESLLLNVMAKFHLWDVITTLLKNYRRRVLFFGLR